MFGQGMVWNDTVKSFVMYPLFLCKVRYIIRSKVNSMADDALAPGGARASSGMMLTIYGGQVLLEGDFL